MPGAVHARLSAPHSQHLTISSISLPSPTSLSLPSPGNICLHRWVVDWEIPPGIIDHARMARYPLYGVEDGAEENAILGELFEFVVARANYRCATTSSSDTLSLASPAFLVGKARQRADGRVHAQPRFSSSLFSLAAKPFHQCNLPRTVRPGELAAGYQIHIVGRLTPLADDELVAPTSLLGYTWRTHRRRMPSSSSAKNTPPNETSANKSRSAGSLGPPRWPDDPAKLGVR